MLNLSEFSERLKNDTLYYDKLVTQLNFHAQKGDNMSISSLQKPDEFAKTQSKTIAIEAALRIIQKAKITS